MPRPRVPKAVKIGCSELLKEGGMPFPGPDVEECVEWLEGTFTEYRDIWRVPSLDQYEEDSIAAHRFMVELAAMVSADFAPMATWRAERGLPVLWPDQRLLSQDGAAVLFSGIFSQLCNYNLGFLALGDRSLELQMLAILRAYLELLNQMKLLLADGAFFKEYVGWMRLAGEEQGRERYGHWRRTMSPARVSRLLSAKADAQFGPEIGAELSDYRDKTYSWLSEHHHGFPLAVVVRSFSEEGPTIGGRATAAVKRAYEAMTWLNFEGFLFFESALHQVQDWRMDFDEPICVELLFKWKLLTKSSLKLMDQEGG